MWNLSLACLLWSNRNAIWWFQYTRWWWWSKIHFYSLIMSWKMFHLFNHLLVLCLNSTTSMNQFITSVSFLTNMPLVSIVLKKYTTELFSESYQHVMSLRHQFEQARHKNKNQLTRSHLRRQIASCNNTVLQIDTN